MKYIKTILLMLGLLLITLLTIIFTSFKTVMLIFSLSFLIMATLFLYDNSLYYKYIKFMNYRAYEILNSKDETYKRKNLRTNIISYYLMSIIMLFNAIISKNDSMDFWFSGSKQLIFFILIGIIYCVIILLISNKLLRVSKTNKSFTFLAIISGTIIGAILILVMTYYIFHFLYI